MLLQLLPFVPAHLARKLIANPDWEEKLDSDRFQGAILFADISGFTPLTELLAASGKEGPEELTRLLNACFNPIIQAMEAESGEVVKFSGDALMVVFPAETRPLAEAIRRAYQAGERMQSLMGEIGELESSAGKVRLEMKIGIGAGEICALEVGGLLGRWEYIVVGDPIRQATAAESRSLPGQVCIDDEAAALMHPEPLPPRKVETVLQPMLKDIDQVEKTLRRFVPGAVVGTLESGARDWMGVLRTMTVLFIGLKDYEFTGHHAATQFHDQVRDVQGALYRFEGSLNKVAVDDKGALIMALFGAPPLAHEDDALRGVKAALEIQALARRKKQPVAIGMTTGRVFAGPVGSAMRYEYTVMGDTVNISARLMKSAGPGGILCDEETWRATHKKIRMETLEPIEVKGKSKPIRVYRPDDQALTSRIVSGSFRPPPMMAGRGSQVQMLDEAIAGLQRGQGTVLVIEGGVGLGKSRLLKEISMQAKVKGIHYLTGRGHSTEATVPLRAWRAVLDGLLELPDDTPEKRLEHAQVVIQDLAPGCLDQMQMLGEWLNVGPARSTLELSLDQEQRERSLLALIKSLVLAWTNTRPLIVSLDDSQWLDPLSWDLLDQLCNDIRDGGHPLFLIVAGRPMERDSAVADIRERIAELDCSSVTQLAALSREHIALLIADRLGVLPAKVPQRLTLFIHNRSEGTPFVAEELVRAMQDQGMIEVWKDEKTNQNLCRVRGEFSSETETLPGTVRGLILARIDRLTANQQVTLKVASVFGRRFTRRALAEILESEYEFEAVKVQSDLDLFHDMELVELESEDPELVYRFQHQITMEVAYESMLYSQRRQLHLAVARWFETHYGEGKDYSAARIGELEPGNSRLTPYLADLAGHYQSAGDAERELPYAVLAGRHAAMLYQNQAAERHFNRALELVSRDQPRDLMALLMECERLYRLMARRSARKDVLRQMQILAQELGENRAKAEVAILQSVYQFTYGRPRSAQQLASSALALALADCDIRLEAKARRWLAAAQQISGQPAEARKEMELALDLAKQVDDKELMAETITQLARLAEKRGEFKLCLKYCEQALDLARTAGDLGEEATILRRMASAHLAMGRLEQSQSLAEQAHEMQIQIGDRRQEGVTVDLQGRIAVARGDYAQGKALFERSLGLRQQIQDRKGQQRSLMLIGEACFRMGSHEKARICYEQALADASEMFMAYDQAEINARLVLLEHSVGDNEKAKRHGLKAAKSLSSLNDPPLLAQTLTALGHAFTELGEYDSAAAAYGNAMQIRQKLGLTHQLMETVAGSARLDFKRGKAGAALTKVNEILARLEEGRLTGVDQPFRLYQTCFEVLEHVEDARAVDLIERAYRELMESAEAISDERMRDLFLSSVIENRAISYYYQGVQRQREQSGGDADQSSSSSQS